jgi:hypothetical protein
MTLTRRAALAAAAALALPASARAQTGPSVTEGDLLVALWRREIAARFAYGEVPGALPARLRIHDGRHAAALATELAAVGLGQPKSPQAVADLDRISARLARASGTGVRPAAIALEQSLVALYGQTLPRLSDAKIAMTVATILASHAQHELMLRADHGLPVA